MSHVPVKESCIFCQIIAGDARSHPVYEDEHILAFLDLFPVSEGHTLIIPKPHWENIFETPTESLARVIEISKPLAHTLKTTFEPDGLGVFQLNGAAAGQTVFHYHMHLIPRWYGASLAIHGRIRAEREQLDDLAERIRANRLPPLI